MDERAIRPIQHSPEYQGGYAEGFKDGYYKALEDFPSLNATFTNPRIIVTTEENLEKIKKDFLKDK